MKFPHVLRGYVVSIIPPVHRNESYIYNCCYMTLAVYRVVKYHTLIGGSRTVFHVAFLV